MNLLYGSLKGILVNVADGFINVDDSEEGINLVGVTSKVFPIMTFYLFINIKQLNALQLILA